MPTNDQDARALTYLARRMRDETHGARQWDEAGTYAVVAKLVGQNLAVTCERVLRHAADQEAKTPGAITRPFVPAAAESTTPRNVWPDDAHRCRTCNLNRPEHDRREANMPEHSRHDFEVAVGDRRLPADQAHAVVGELRDHKHADPPPRPAPEVGTEGTTRVQPIRAAIAARKEDDRG